MSFFGGLRSQKSAPEDAPEKEKNEKAEAPRPPAPIKRPTVGFETVIGSNTTFFGELRSQSDVRIDGTFDGTLEIEGNVLVGETGKVNADIHAKNVSVAGAVRGDISGKKVQLLRTARVWGNISALAITTEEGAFIDGKLTMVHHDASTEGMELSLPAPQTPNPEPAHDDIEVVEGEAVSED